MGQIIKGVAETWEYSITTTAWDNPGGATWVSLPVLQLLANGFQKFSEEAQLVQSINSLDLSAAKKGVLILAVAYQDDDTFLATLETAEACHTPTWLKVKPFGRDERIVGGVTGGAVYVNKDPIPEFGDLVNAMVGFSATGADPNDTWKIIPGSGS